MDQMLYDEEKLIGRVHVADTFLKRFLGFMMRKQPHHQILMISPCNSIHTFFMRFDIDVLFVDRDFCVLRKIEGLKPGKIVMPVKGAMAVLETKTGGFKNINVGARIWSKYGGDKWKL